jgi:hypothetical protein
MPLARGAQLGPYEISGLLGAGGMGEVYRARDTRLGRDVAVKVIPEELAAHEDRLRRFEQEARATAALNHPNILALFDVGVEGEVHYVVEELLEGETLRERLRRERLPVREAVEWGAQMARGLAAAHERGIVHRDLKPENVFLTRDGRVKLLDFGLAKLRDAGPAETEAATATAATDAGTRLGTLGYMSPEQVRGEAADARSDIFSLGVVLYEMVEKRRAFAKESTVETLHAILSEDPPELTVVGTTMPVALDRVIRRCLEKRPEGRFQSAHDVALALEVASAPASAAVAIAPKPRPWLAWAMRLGLPAVLAAAFAGVFLAGQRCAGRPVPSYRQLTFRRGVVTNARFAPDGQTVVYSARWEGKPSEVFTTRLDLADSQALSLAQGARLDGLHGGEALIRYEDSRLARVPLVGGTPRDVAENVDESDWGPTGDIAVIRPLGLRERFQLEYPVGKTLLQSSFLQGLRDVRVSPQGDRVALVVGEFGANGGDVVVVDRSGHRTAVSKGWMEVFGLAWSPDGREVWFTAAGGALGGGGWVGAVKEVHALSLAGRERLLLRMAGDLTLCDVLRDGRVLLSHGRTRGEARGKLAGDESERDLTYLDGTLPVGVSADGRAVLFQEQGQAGGLQNTTYLRRVGDLGPIRLGESAATGLSPDGKRALAVSGGLMQSGNRLLLLSAGAEPPRELPRGSLESVGWAWWTPDDRQVIFLGREKDEARRRSYILQPPDGQPRPISPDGTECRPAWLGWALCERLPEEKGQPVSTWELHSLDGGETRPAPWIGREETPIAWGPDGRHAFMAGLKQPPFRVFRLDATTGRREPWLDTSSPEAAGVQPLPWVGAALTPDGRYYAYGYLRVLSDLFLVEGLR